MMPPFNRRELSDMAIANSDARCWCWRLRRECLPPRRRSTLWLTCVGVVLGFCGYAWLLEYTLGAP